MGISELNSIASSCVIGKRCVAIICAIVGCCGGCMAVGSSIDDEIIKSAKRIPVVGYIPLDFNRIVVGAFTVDDSAECYFVHKNNDDVEIYWYNDFSRKYDFKLSRLDDAVSLSTAQIDVMLNQDSVFIFNPIPNIYEFIPQHLKYVGWLENGQIRYIAGERVYDKISEMVTDEFGSVANFTQRYLASLSRAFYSAGSMLYDFEADDEAIGFLRDNYKFMAVCGQNGERVMQKFINLLGKVLRISDVQAAILVDECRIPARETLISSFLTGKNESVIGLAALSSAFSPAECEVVENLMDEDDARLWLAYRKLALRIANVDETGRYRTDRDVLAEVSRLVFPQ